MTDPRIVECAKAFEAVMEIDHDARITNLPEATTACVLKWLEQRPTGEMLATIARYVSRGDTSARAALSCYIDVSAQAAKEIAGE